MSELKNKFARVSFQLHGSSQKAEIAKESFVIGRGSQADLRIDVPGLSRKHVEIEIKNGKIKVKDLGSLNGSILGSTKMNPEEWYTYTAELSLKLGVPPIPIVIEAIDEAAQQILNSAEGVAQAPAVAVKTGTHGESAQVLTQGSATRAGLSVVKFAPSPPQMASQAPQPPRIPEGAAARPILSAEKEGLQLQLDHLKGEVARHSRINKQLQELKTETETDLERARIEFETIQKDYQKFLAENGHIRQGIENEIKSLQDECDGLSLARDQIKDQKEKNANELKEAEEKVQNTKELLKNLELEVQSKKNSLESAEKDRIEAQAEESLAKENLESLTKQSQEVLLSLKNHEQEIQEKKNLASKLSASELESTAKLAQLREEIRRIESDLEDAQTRDRKRKAELAADEAENKLRILKIEAESEKALNTRKILERELFEVESKLSTLKIELNESQLQLNESEKSKKEISKTLDKDEIKVKDLETQISRLEIEQASLLVNVQELEKRREDQMREFEAERESVFKEIQDQRASLEKQTAESMQQARKELQAEREEMLRKAQSEKERLLSEGEKLRSRQERQGEDENEKRRKAFELELSEMKFKASEEIRLLREDEERQLQSRRKREISNLEKSLTQVIKNGLPLLQSANFSEESQKQISGELKRAARTALGFEREEIEIDSNLKNFVPFNPEAESNEKRFWKLVFVRGGIGLALFVILFFTPLVRWAGESTVKYFKETKTSSEVFVKRMLEARANRPKYDPPQLRSYQNSYTDNVIFSEGYSILKTTPEVEDQWVLELNKFFTDEIDAGDRLVAEFVPFEGRLIADLVQLRAAIKPEDSDTGVKKMRELEEQKVQTLIEMIGGPQKYFEYREFEKQFYEKFLASLKD